MDSSSSFKFAPPQHLYESYKCIRNSNLITNQSLDVENIYELQQHLNNAQPKNEDETTLRSLVQYFYRKNPINFCRFLVHSRLNHLILWTEAKCIVRHFGLQGVVYIKWDEGSYHCSLHQNVNMNKQTDVEDTFVHQRKNNYNNRKTYNGSYSKERSNNSYKTYDSDNRRNISKSRRPHTPENSPTNRLAGLSVNLNKSYSESVQTSE